MSGTSVAMMVTSRDEGLRGSAREMTGADVLATGGVLPNVAYIENAAAPGTTNIVAATASSAANALVVAASPDLPRNLRYVFAASYDGGDITVNGLDQFDKPVTEVIVAAAGSTVVGTKIFKKVLSASKGQVGATANTVSIGTGSKLGVKLNLSKAVGLLSVANVLEAVTVDTVYAGITPTTAPNGSVDYFFIGLS